ncbi:MAG: GIY-YIG nuclease family protein, partial [Chloroflexota bacterium]
EASLTSDAFLILLKQAAAKGYTTLADLRAGRPRKEELGTGEQVSGIGGQVPVGQRFEDLHPLPVIQHPIPDTLFEMPLPEPEAELEEVTPEPEEEILSRPAQMPSRPRYRPEIASLTNRATARARYLLSKDLLRDLPEKPGVYLMKDSGGTVIYVGKAKNLYHRVSSYYSQPLGYTRKLDGLIESIDRIDHIVVGSELEALLLESKLIKRYLPRYNTQQRNYEAYPFIKIDLSQRFPRIYSCREILDDGARYFGPFKSRRAVETTVEIIEQFFPIRTCTRSFEWETLNRKRRLDSPCLRESLKRCPGPCTGSYSDEAHHGYMLIIEEVINFLSGEKQTMLDTLWERLQKASKNEDYERAAALRDGYQQVEKIIGSQKFLAAAVEGNNVLIALPSIETGAVELLCIYRGRLGRQVRLLLDAVPSGDTLAQIWQELAARESELAANQPGWGKH